MQSSANILLPNIKLRKVLKFEYYCIVNVARKFNQISFIKIRKPSKVSSWITVHWSRPEEEL